MVKTSVQIKKQIEDEKKNLAAQKRVLKRRLSQLNAQQKAVFSSDDKVRKLQANLTKTLDSERRKGIVHPPATFLGWALVRRDNRFIFGCGDITVNAEQLRSFIRIEEAINKHFNASTRILAHKKAHEVASSLVITGGHLPAAGLTVLTYSVSSPKPREYQFGCGAVTATYNEVYMFQRIHAFTQTHRLSDIKDSAVRRGKILSMAKRLLKILTK